MAPKLKQTISAVAAMLLLAAVASFLIPAEAGVAFPWGHRQAKIARQADNDLPQGAISDIRSLIGDVRPAAKDARIYLHAGKVAAKAFVADIEQQEAQAFSTLDVPVSVEVQTPPPPQPLPNTNADAAPAAKPQDAGEAVKQDGCAGGACNVGVMPNISRIFRSRGRGR
jgi:hypothetical protein